MSRFERWSVWVTSILVAVSGVGYLWTKYLLEPAGPFAVVNHPLEPWFLRLHVLSAPFFLFAMGLIAVKHVWRHYRSGIRWGRKSGVVTMVALVPMVLSGYLIQVVTAREWLTAMVVGHIVLSFAFVVSLAAHQWIISKTDPPPSSRDARGRPRAERRRADRRSARDDAPSPAAGTRRPSSGISRERTMGAGTTEG